MKTETPSVDYYTIPILLVSLGLILKFLHVIDYSFWIIFAPLWVPFAVLISFILSAAAWGVLRGLYRVTVKKFYVSK
jgi:hypothetical protein